MQEDETLDKGFESKANNSPNNIPEFKNTIPTLMERMQAVFLDSIVLCIMMFVAYKIFDSFEEEYAYFKMLTFIFIFGIYDPLLTSLFGGTLGHRAMNLRVKRDKNRTENVLLPLAFIRFVIKAIFGWVSLILVSVDSKGRGIHDLFVGSVVVYHKNK